MAEEGFTDFDENQALIKLDVNNSVDSNSSQEVLVNGSEEQGVMGQHTMQSKNSKFTNTQEAQNFSVFFDESNGLPSQPLYSNKEFYRRGDNYKSQRDQFRLNCANDIPTNVTIAWNSLTVKVRKQTPVEKVLSFNYKNRDKREKILDGVKGIVEPGEMLALMGASGSGKTTLLNALNFSVKDPLEVYGKIFINGVEADSTRMKIISSYIQQDDLFFGTLTVKEHLIFHAMLRMDKNITKEGKIKRVNQVLKEFNLDKRADVKIGIPGRIKGISGGEKRRLLFASEILTDPPVLFCDEPTSGLDAYMAKSIIFYLQKLARSGKTIICSIHQPSSEAFSMFDKICLLSQTRLAFFGTKEDALNFFTKNLLKVYPPFTNPADFYIDMLGVDVNDSENSKSEIQRYCDVFQKSQYNQELIHQISSTKQEYFSVPADYTHYKASWFDQMVCLSKRSFFNYFRNHKLIINDFGMVIITALLGGSIFFRTSEAEGEKCYFDQTGIENVALALYYTLTVCVIFSMLAAVMAFPLEIPIYFREHSSFVYRSDTYYLSKFLVDLPLNILLPTLHAYISYKMIGYGCDGSNFRMFLFIIILVSNSAYSIGHILSIVSSDASIAVGLIAPVVAVQMLFSSFFLGKTPRTPKWLTHIKNLSIFRYGYDLLLLNQWQGTNTAIKCEYDLEVLCLKTGESVIESLEIDPVFKWLNIAMLILLAVSFRLIAFTILWNKGRRGPLKLEYFLSVFRRSSSINRP